MIARVEYPQLDAGPYLEELDAWGRDVAGRVAAARARAEPGTEARAQVTALSDFVFRELGFVGNERQYEDPRNSFLNEVLDRRTGIPITLALVYMELARRADVNVTGVNFPGRFLLRSSSPDNDFNDFNEFHHRSVRRRRDPDRNARAVASCFTNKPARTPRGTRACSPGPPSPRFSRGCCST